MLNRLSSKKSTDVSFVPEDYIARRAERRTNFVYLILFSVVMFAIVAAFFVNNRSWNDVKQYQEAINVQFSQAAKDIEQVKTLEEQKARLLERAELTTALIEKVPRTVMLAEIINRMPEEMTLLDFELKSKRIAEPVKAPTAPKGTSSLSGKTKARTSPDAAGKPAEDRPVAPRYETSVVLIGVTPTHGEVAQYVAALQDSPLLSEVELRFSEFTIIEEMGMNRFRIDAQIAPTVDARTIDPLEAPRRLGGTDARSIAEVNDE